MDIFQEWPTIRRCRACDDYLFRDDIRSRHKISRGERLARKCPAPIRSSLLTSAIIALINWPPAHLAGCGPRGYVAVSPPVANLVSRTEEARLLPQPPPIISPRERGITLCHCALIEDLIFKATGGAGPFAHRIPTALLSNTRSRKSLSFHSYAYFIYL